MSGNFGDMDALKPTEDRRQVIFNPIGYTFDRHAANPSLAAEFRDGLTFHIHTNGLTAGKHLPPGFRSQDRFGDGH